MWPVAVGVLALASWTAFLNLGTTTFLPGSCERVDSYLRENIVGQDLAIDQLVTALCTHLDKPEPQKPLIMSAHGPPGVGKTYTHLLLARALYNRRPDSVSNCPGSGCAGYKVIYGLDFHEANRQEQLAAVKESIMTHVQGARDPLLVFEEYDKLDCTTRLWLRHMLSQASDMGTMRRAVVLLESNLGYTQLEEMLTDVNGDTTKLTFEGAERTLRDALFASWRSTRPTPSASVPSTTPTQTTTPGGGGAAGQHHVCEEAYVDTLRFTALIDFFLPYLPLQRQHVETLVRNALQRERVRLQDLKHVTLEWDDGAVAWLTNKVEFDGPYPLEGAKQVSSVITRYVAPQVRRCPDASHDKAQATSLKLKFTS